MRIGKRLKLIRKERGMTLGELSKKSGVAIATLSRMEHDIMPGTLKSHVNICRALGINLADFYHDIESERKTISHIRHKEKGSPFVSAKDVQIEMLTTKITQKNMLPLLIRLQKRGSSRLEENKPGVEKFVYLVEGEILAVIGKETHRLHKGDSIYFDASLKHAFKNNSKRESLALSVSSPPAA